MLAVALAFLLGWFLARARGRKALRRNTRAIQQQALEHRGKLEVASRRARLAERAVEDLTRTVRELPEIAQRLTATQEVRQIPDLTLDLVEEVFAPRFAVFFVEARGKFIAASVRGASAFKHGQRVESEEGIVGWTATKQLPLTPGDIELETAVERARHLGDAGFEEFEVCLPIVRDRDTLGVILIGPARRKVPYAREIARTIALITSVAITSTKLLLKQTTLAQSDGLTGLLNKTYIVESFEKLLAETGPAARAVSAFLFDIDHFKTYNDSNGHLAGDELLKGLGRLLRESIREGELVGRYGGEEFLVILPGADRDEALAAADRIRTRIAECDFPYRETQPDARVSISGGVATYPQDGREAEVLLRRADEALYEAKNSGRNRVLAYTSPELASEDPSPLELGDDQSANGS